MQTPPYTITSKILYLVSEIQSLLGESKHLTVKKPSVKLRKENKIKTIHHSLAIEGNGMYISLRARVYKSIRRRQWSNGTSVATITSNEGLLALLKPLSKA